MVEPRYRDLSLVAQTTYAELLEAARAWDLSRSVAHLSGSFASKRVKGHSYWYFQYRDIDGSLRQLYVGPDDEKVRALVARSREKVAGNLQPLARALVALGGERSLPKHFRIVR